ncbi:hypothetical protein JZ751_006165 [Albula glossodonta]|uniref:CD80-like immunoglobulin C2-set domain-containing protein n=1 Tax=Albula glossodonta TaxID=121402 RepID=A0A8T2N4S9_9TELE|nr:hypothetical protein JZ751_006165 [Albula glossodonta]
MAQLIVRTISKIRRNCNCAFCRFQEGVCTVTGDRIFKEEAWETPSNKNSSEVVVSCTGTGKPAPEIKWGATDAVPKEQRIPNDDGTVTVVSNITLHLSECSGSDVICTLSNSVETKTLTVPLCRKPPEGNSDEGSEVEKFKLTDVSR